MFTIFNKCSQSNVGNIYFSDENDDDIDDEDANDDYHNHWH